MGGERWDDYLLLDGGDVFQQGFSVPQDPARRAALEALAEYIVDRYGALGYEAVALGDRDLALGPELLGRLAKRAKFPFLAANVVRPPGSPKAGEPYFGATLVHQTTTQDGRVVKIGVIGVTGQVAGSRAGAGGESPPWRIEDPLPVVRRYVEGLRARGVQIVLVLGHLTNRDQQRIADAVPGITAILGGAQAGAPRHPDQRGATFLVQGGSKGKHLATLLLHVHPGSDLGLPFVDRGLREGIRGRIRELTRRISSYERILARREKSAAKGVGGAPPGSKAAEREAANLKYFRDQLVKLRADKAQAELELAQAQDVDPKRDYATFELIGLEPSIADDPAEAKALAAYRAAEAKGKPAAKAPARGRQGAAREGTRAVGPRRQPRPSRPVPPRIPTRRARTGGGR